MAVEMTASLDDARDATVWHGVTAEEACAQLGVDPARGLEAAEVERRREQVGPNKLAEAKKEPGWQAFLRQYRDLMQLVLVGAAARQHDRAAGVLHRARHHRPDRPQRGPGPESGGQGGRERRRAPEDARDQGSCPPRRPAWRRPRRGARAGRRRRLRGRRQGPRGRSPARGRDARDRGVRADGREHAGPEGGRAGGRRRGAARRPSRHGLHELDRDAGQGRDGRHDDGDGDRGRPDLGDAERRPAGEDAAHAPARPADRPAHDHGGSRAGARRRPRAHSRRRLRRALPDRDQPRGGRDPDRSARGRHDRALAGNAGARGQGCDREAAALGRDARLDVGDLLGQDRHADAQPDDRAAARGCRPALLDRGRGLLDRRQDPARCGRDGHLARAVPAADGACERRCGSRRRDRRRPDGGGARRARGEGRDRRRRDAARSTRAWARCRSTPTTSSWRRSTRWRTRAGRSFAASSRARPTFCSRARRRSGTRTARPFPPRAGRDRVLAENDRLAGEGLRVLAVASRDIDPGDVRPRRGRCSTRSRI